MNNRIPLLLLFIFINFFVTKAQEQEISPFHQSTEIRKTKSSYFNDRANYPEAKYAIYVEPGYIGRGYGIGIESRIPYWFFMPYYWGNAGESTSHIAAYFYYGITKNDFWGTYYFRDILTINKEYSSSIIPDYGSLMEYGFKYYVSEEINGSSFSFSTLISETESTNFLKSQYITSNNYSNQYLTSNSIYDYKLQYGYTFNLYERLFAEIHGGIGYTVVDIEYLTINQSPYSSYSNPYFISVQTKTDRRIRPLIGLRVGLMF